MPTIEAGATIEKRTLGTITGAPVEIPAREGLVHLQFRRFAACPICSLHLREVARRQGEIGNAGVTEIAVFHSSPDLLRRYRADLPFAVVADPDRLLYDEFGVEKSVRAVANPKVARAIGRSALRMRSPREAIGSMTLAESHLGLPADFLIASDGVVRACKYGRHADDQWSVDELLDLAAGVGFFSASLKEDGGPGAAEAVG